MPTKVNSAGLQQNYVPAGNGNASGEYADSDTGSNIHYFSEEFKKREAITNDSDKEVEKDDSFKTQLKLFSLKTDMAEIKRDAKRQHIYYLFNKNSRTFEFFTSDDIKEKKLSFWDLLSYNEIYINVLEKEQFDKFLDASLEEIKLTFDTNELTEDEMLERMPSETVGMYGLIDEIGFVNGSDENKKRSRAAIKLFDKMYGGEKFDKYKEQIKEIFNERRKKLGSEYLEKNFKKGEPKTMDDALQLANPNYHMGGGFRINCQRCSFVYELLRRGYEVEAKPNDDGYSLNNQWMAQMVFKEKHEINAGNYRTLQKKVFDVVKKAGNGARFCISCSWKGSNGHAFIIENVDGEVMTLDAQNGSKNVDYYFEQLKSKAGGNLLRMDNADFSGSVAKTAFPLKEKKINFIQRGKEND